MTDCENVEIRELLPEHLHVALSPRERAAVERHLASCAECAGELVLLAQARRGMSRTPAVDLEGLGVAVAAATGRSRSPLDGTGREVKPAPRSRPQAVRPWQRIAAAVLVVGGLAAAGLAAGTVRSGTDAVEDVASLGAQTSGERPSEPVPSRPATAAAPALSLGGMVSALTDAELEALISELDDMATVPAAEPRPILLVEPVTDGDGAGS